MLVKFEIMTREEKSQVIEDLTGKLADNSNLFSRYLRVECFETSNLRRACFKANVNWQL